MILFIAICVGLIALAVVPAEILIACVGIVALLYIARLVNDVLEFARRLRSRWGAK